MTTTCPLNEGNCAINVGKFEMRSRYHVSSNRYFTNNKIYQFQVPSLEAVLPHSSALYCHLYRTFLAAWLSCLLLQPCSAGERELMQDLVERRPFSDVRDKGGVPGEGFPRSAV